MRRLRFVGTLRPWPRVMTSLRLARAHLSQSPAVVRLPSTQERHISTIFRRYERLLEEVLFSTNRALREIGVKTHSVSGRVKDVESFVEKVDRKGYTDPFSDTDDIVGIRIVGLFLSDLPKLEEMIESAFDVMSTEDHIEGAPADTFGYMSIHFVCQLGEGYSGARYDDVKGEKFEVQVRTILMDAWANVSHYLAYKGDSSIPAHLRRDFFALSGLFYVADQHFELFFKHALEEQNAAREAIQSNEADDLELNLESTAALLSKLFADRETATRADIAQFVDEARRAGYTKVGALETALKSGLEGALRYEEQAPPLNEADEPSRFTSVGWRGPRWR